ncbi:MAG: hypothetical protein KJ886_05045 [Candidatus Thermoplasmatota archaeon]|nr:hypothetical protein [Candidatus Thermoplasmatota archaeon]
MEYKSGIVNDVLVKIENLNLEEKEYLSEILSRRLIELRRKAIAKRSKEAEEAYRKGKVKSGTFDK